MDLNTNFSQKRLNLAFEVAVILRTYNYYVSFHLFLFFLFLDKKTVK